MQIFNLAALGLLATSVLAADCSGNSGKDLYAWRNAWWDARQKMCSNSDCGYQKECTTYSSQKANKKTVSVSLSRKYTGSKQGFKDCWDATENIINQCVNGERKLSGTWAWDGQLYQFNGHWE